MTALAYTEHVYEDRAAWLAARREGIGGSDAPAVVGQCPWMSPAKLFALKAGLIPEDEEAREEMELGRVLEPVILNLYRERAGRTVLAPRPWLIRRSVAHPFMAYSPDGWAMDEAPGRGRGVVQCKAVSEWRGREWLEDEPPAHYLLQLQHEIAVEGAAWGALAALIGGRRFRFFEYDRHERLIGLLVERERAFMDGVIQGVAPVIDGSEASAALLKAMHPKEDGSVVNLPDEAAEWHATRLEADREIKRWEAVRAEQDNKIKAAIGDHEVGMLPGLVAYSWKTEQRTYKATAERVWHGRVLRCRMPSPPMERSNGK